MKINKAIITFLLVISMTPLSACESLGLGGGQSSVKKSHIGTLVGAAAGATAGSNIGKGKGNIAAIAAGTLLGAFAGHEIGASLDRADRLYVDNTTQRALELNPTGTVSEWKNPDSGNSGKVVPNKTFKSRGGQYCREFTQEIAIGGRPQQAYGTACRQPDGTWQIVSN